MQREIIFKMKFKDFFPKNHTKSKSIHSEEKKKN